MSADRLEVFTAQVLEKTFPGWMRGKGILVLVGDFIPHWQGPEPAGRCFFFASTFHIGPTMDSPGQTMWFLGQEGTENPFCVDRWQQGADYISARLYRRHHTPVTGFTSYLFPVVQPGTN